MAILFQFQNSFMRSLRTAWCSIFENKYSTSPKSITLFDALSTSWQADILSEIRQCEYKSPRQQYLKGKLLAITPCSQQLGGRGERFHHSHSGYLAFDVDGLGERLDNIFKRIIAIPYIAYCGKSASGNGLWGLIPIEFVEFHKEHFDAMVQYFYSLDITLDTAPRNVASYRFLSFDPNAFFNDEAVLFKKRLFPETVVSRLLTGQLRSGMNGNIWQDFNSQADKDIINTILLNAGWKCHSHKGPRIRYTRPGKEVRNGLSAEYHTTLRTFFVFSSEAPAAQFFINKKGGSPCDILIHYAAYGDRKRAYQILKSLIKQ